MKLIRELLEYCDGKGLLTPQQYRGLKSLCDPGSPEALYSCPAPRSHWEDWGGDGYWHREDDSYFSEEGDEGEQPLLRSARVPPGSDPAPANPTDRRGKGGSPCKSRRREGAKAKSGTVMKLPALGNWLSARFETLLAAPGRILSPVLLMHGTANAMDWLGFQTAVRDLNRMGAGEFGRAFESALRPYSRRGISLNRICALIEDRSEMELPDAHGPAISAYRLLARLQGQAPPTKLLWMFRNDVVATVHQYWRFKARMAESVRFLWREKRDFFEQACIASIAPLPKNDDWLSLRRHRDVSAMEAFALLREGANMLHGVELHHPLLNGVAANLAELMRFGKESWAMALLIDEKATMKLLAACRDLEASE